MVVDEDTGALLGEVTGVNVPTEPRWCTPPGSGMQLGNDQSVVEFDLKTLRVIRRYPAAEDVDAILFDPASGYVLTMNGDAHSSTVIEPRHQNVVTNIPLGGKPEYGASAGDGMVYANLTDVSEVVKSMPT